MNTERNRKIIYWLLPVMGAAFCLWYVKNATCDVVYSDYIRLVNSYLPDVYDPSKFFVPDVLTRIPINYLSRIVNVELFGFSITFERVLGVAGLGLAGLVFGIYCKNRKIGSLWFALLMAVMFSLNKWEMLTNGSGWAHFFAFACFYYHELVLDRVWSGQEKKHDRVKLLVLPWLIILGTAGPYCAIYAVTLIMSYAFCMVWDRYGQRDGAGLPREAGLPYGTVLQRETAPAGRVAVSARPAWDTRYLAYIVCVLVPLLLYILSNSFAVEEHAGATGRSMMEILSDNPSFPVRFMLKSFAGILVGGEELQELMKQGVMSSRMCYLLGAFVVMGYLLALWMNLRLRIYEKTILPMMLLAGGGLNHVIIFISRYIFESESYALSSRYALQFQVGILGMVITFALAWNRKAGKQTLRRILVAVFCLAILAGNGYTTYHEIKKAPNREESFENKARVAIGIPDMTQEELESEEADLADLYEYRKGVDKIQDAFRILKDNRLNVFH